MPRLGTAFLCLFLIAGCASGRRYAAFAPSPAPWSDYEMPVANLDEWLAEHPLAPDQDAMAVELHRTPFSSMHIVQIRSREAFHIHEEHKIMVMLHRGHGTLLVGPQRRKLMAGSLTKVLHGVPHAFVNEGDDPAVAFVVFSPPYDPKDFVPELYR
jgi:mannose-6-phosphate isomerase-like protein (cupin superfamily)